MIRTITGLHLNKILSGIFVKVTSQTIEMLPTVEMCDPGILQIWNHLEMWTKKGQGRTVSLTDNKHSDWRTPRKHGDICLEGLIHDTAFLREVTLGYHCVCASTSAQWSLTLRRRLGSSRWTHMAITVNGSISSSNSSTKTQTIWKHHALGAFWVFLESLSKCQRKLFSILSSEKGGERLGERQWFSYSHFSSHSKSKKSSSVFLTLAFVTASEMSKNSCHGKRPPLLLHVCFYGTNPRHLRTKTSDQMGEQTKPHRKRWTY